MQRIPLSKPMTPELARAIYACLIAGVDAPVNPDDATFFTLKLSRWDGAEWVLGEWKIRINIGKSYQLIWTSDGISIDVIERPMLVDHLKIVDRTMRALAVLMEGK